MRDAAPRLCVTKIVYQVTLKRCSPDLATVRVIVSPLAGGRAWVSEQGLSATKAAVILRHFGATEVVASQKRPPWSALSQSRASRKEGVIQRVLYIKHFLTGPGLAFCGRPRKTRRETARKSARRAAAERGQKVRLILVAKRGRPVAVPERRTQWR